MTQLSEHFTLEEMIFSQTAVRNNINNNPSQAVINNLRVTCADLEAIRALLEYPLSISSGFRCMELNRKIGGAITSAHMDGYAADFTCAQFGSSTDIVDKIRESGIKLDQCIEEGTWVHVSFAPTLRQQFMKAKFINGQPHYTNY